MSKPKLFTSILYLFLLQFYGFIAAVFQQFGFGRDLYISTYFLGYVIIFFGLLIIFSLISLVISLIKKNQFSLVFGKVVELSIWILGVIYSIIFLSGIWALSQGGYKQMLLP